MTSSTSTPAAQASVPLRIAFEVEVPGTPEQVWAAIATTDGLSAWFLPTDVEERVGGALVTHMGDTDSPGTITAWEPPHRLVYEEPEWASLMGQGDAAVTPLASEFLVEARGGGTCVVRVVSSAFGTGADWENEFMTEMERGWKPFFENLRLYLTHFAGRRATSLELSTTVPKDPATTWTAVSGSLGGVQAGRSLAVRDLEVDVQQASEGALLARVEGAASGLLGLHAYGTSPDTSTVVLRTWLFSDSAPAYVERERDAWQSWLDALAR